MMKSSTLFEHGPLPPHIHQTSFMVSKASGEVNIEQKWSVVVSLLPGSD